MAVVRKKEARAKTTRFVSAASKTNETPSPASMISGKKKPLSCSCGCCEHGFGKKIMATLVGVLLVYGIFYVGVLIRNNLKDYSFIGLADKSERFITVSGVGKITGSNDVAVTTVGYSNVSDTVTVAQEENKKVMDKVMADLKQLGISDDDLKSDYSIYPEYQYTQDEGSKLVGYRVSNTVTVKIRDLTKIEQVLSLAGKYGANQVSGLQFTIDDESALKSQARDKALIDASKNLKYLSDVLGVQVGKVVSYNEYSSGDDTYYKYASSESYGIGGGVAPISSGSGEITSNVSVTYELL